MFETKMICDRCGREEKVKSTYTYPQKWVSLSIKYKDGKYKCEQIKEYHLCEECAKKDLRADGVSEGVLLDKLDKIKTTQVKPDGFIQFSHEGEIRTTYRDTPDGWYEVDKVTTIQRK